MEATNSQSAAILQNPHPSRLLWMFPVCQVGWVTHTAHRVDPSRIAVTCLQADLEMPPKKRSKHHDSYITVWLCTGTSSGGVSPTRKEQPLFTLRQVGMICERLLKEREEKVREEYEETMTSKLAGWYTRNKDTLLWLGNHSLKSSQFYVYSFKSEHLHVQ